jgi:hypothetical protein
MTRGLYFTNASRTMQNRSPNYAIKMLERKFTNTLSWTLPRLGGAEQR